MSYPYWPQSMFGYRPSRLSPGHPRVVYGVHPGYAGMGGFHRGSMSPKTDWATPRYVRNEPDGVDGFGAFGEGATDCFGAARKALLDIVVKNTIGRLPGSLTDAASFLTGGPIADKVTNELNNIIGDAQGDLFKALYNVVETGKGDFYAALIRLMRTTPEEVSNVNFLDLGTSLSIKVKAAALAASSIIYNAMQDAIKRCATPDVADPYLMNLILDPIRAELAKQQQGQVQYVSATPILSLSTEQSQCLGKLTDADFKAGYSCDQSGRLTVTDAAGRTRWVVDQAFLAKFNERVPAPAGDVVANAQLRAIKQTASATATGGALPILAGAALLAVILLKSKGG